MSGEAFENACLQPESSRRHATRLSDTLGGNTISGNELGAGEQLTGNRTGVCQTVTGTEYMAAGQFSVCHAGTRRHDGPGTSDQTTDGLPVSGGERNHAKVTGTESSSMVSMTGSQYLSQGLAATQSSRHHGETLRNPDRLTGALLSTNRHVTGDTRSVGNQVTGDNYVANDLSRSTQSGSRQRFGGNRLATDRISGSIPQRSQAVTGDEPGTCQHLTGTPYVGRDTQVEFCDEVGAVETARRMAGSVISGIPAWCRQWRHRRCAWRRSQFQELPITVKINSMRHLGRHRRAVKREISVLALLLGRRCLSNVTMPIASLGPLVVQKARSRDQMKQTFSR